MVFKWRYALAFGSNLGDRYKNCARGFDFLKGFGQLEIVSPFVETKPLKSDLYPKIEEGFYLNAICDFATNASPDELYERIARIEDEVGHQRERKWLPRELDIDILLWAKNQNSFFQNCPQKAFKKDSLEVPHPELHKRDFLLDLLEEHLLVDTCLLAKVNNYGGL